MKAIILAAGMGTRLGTLIPKPLTSLVDERTIMDFQVDRLKAKIGLDNIFVVVGYKKELIMEKFPELTYVYNPAYAHTNTSKSLLAALSKIDDDVIWMNGDVFFEIEALELMVKAKTSAALIDTKKCGDEEIKYTLNDDGFIHNLSKQVQNGLGEAVGVNYLIRSDVKKVRDALNIVADQDYFEKALENLTISSDLKFAAISTGKYFCQEIDFVEDLEYVSKYASSRSLF